jgi:hypothetical protein
MAVSLKNLTVNAEELRAKLKAEQDVKEQKAAPKTSYDDIKFKGELIGMKTNYVLRILPNTYNNGGKDEPWVQTLVHIFPNPAGLKKFAMCPATLDSKAPCPLCEKSRELFKKVNDKTATKSEEDTARRFYKKPRYFVNVLVVEDPRPVDKGNQKGKVLVWEMGPQIHERLKEALVEQGKEFHSVSAGYNFNLVIKKKGEHPNYESSTFASDPTPITNDDAELDRISNAIVDLKKFALGKGPKSYDDLKALMEGREPVRQEREYDSETGVTTSRPTGRAALNEAVDLDAPVPAAPVAAAAVASASAAPKAAPAKQLSDEELLAQLDELDAK